MHKIGPTNGPAPTRRWRNDASTPAFARSALSCSTSARTAAGCRRALISATSAQVLTATGGCSGLVRHSAALRSLTVPVLELPPDATRRDAIGVYLALNGGGTPHTADELERVRDLLRGES